MKCRIYEWEEKGEILDEREEDKEVKDIRKERITRTQGEAHRGLLIGILWRNRGSCWIETPSKQNQYLFPVC